MSFSSEPRDHARGSGQSGKAAFLKRRRQGSGHRQDDQGPARHLHRLLPGRILSSSSSPPTFLLHPPSPCNIASPLLDHPPSILPIFITTITARSLASYPVEHRSPPLGAWQALVVALGVSLTAFPSQKQQQQQQQTRELPPGLHGHHCSSLEVNLPTSSLPSTASQGLHRHVS